MKDNYWLDELFRILFIEHCNKRSQLLSELFEIIHKYPSFLQGEVSWSLEESSSIKSLRC